MYSQQQQDNNSTSFNSLAPTMNDHQQQLNTHNSFMNVKDFENFMNQQASSGVIHFSAADPSNFLNGGALDAAVVSTRSNHTNSSSSSSTTGFMLSNTSHHDFVSSLENSFAFDDASALVMPSLASASSLSSAGTPVSGINMAGNSILHGGDVSSSSTSPSLIDASSSSFTTPSPPSATGLVVTSYDLMSSHSSSPLNNNGGASTPVTPNRFARSNAPPTLMIQTPNNTTFPAGTPAGTAFHNDNNNNMNHSATINAFNTAAAPISNSSTSSTPNHSGTSSNHLLVPNHNNKFHNYRENSSSLESPLMTPKSAAANPFSFNSLNSPSLIQSAPLQSSFNPFFPSNFFDNSQLFTSQPGSPMSSITASVENMSSDYSSSTRSSTTSSSMQYQNITVPSSPIASAYFKSPSSRASPLKLKKHHGHARVKSSSALAESAVGMIHDWKVSSQDDSSSAAGDLHSHQLDDYSSTATFPSAEDIRHASMMAAEGAKSFSCTFPGCERVFSQFQNLKSHWRCHSEIKKFACDECDARFRRLPDLYRHRRSLHSAGKPHECEMCGKSFARADALRRHLLSKNKPRGCTGVRKEEDGNASSLDLNVAAGHVVGLVMEAPPNSAVSAPGDHYAHGFSYSGHHQPQHMDQMFAVEDQTSSAVSYDAGYTMMSRSLDNGLLHLSSDGYSASNLPFSPM